MADRDYYEILEVAPDATPDQIKKAYRGKARKFHPDVNPGDKSAESKFKEAQQAYDILSDPEKRKLYDQYGKAAFEGVGPGPRAGASEWAAQHGAPSSEFVDFSEFFGPGAGGARASGATMGGAGTMGGGGIFEEIFGRMRGGGSRRGGQAGRETEASLTIPFLTAVRGGETTIEVLREGGRRETLNVKIPPGIESGAKLRLKGRGEPGSGGAAAGDLIIRVEVQPHPYFTREGRNLLVEVPLSLPEAALGARVEVPTLDGFKTLPIPAGTSSGQKLRLRGQGVPARGEKLAGDLFVVAKVVVPKELDEESRELVRQLGEKNPQDPRRGLW